MTWVLCGSLSTFPCFAATPEPLDTEFLDYLANCEGKEDDWTLVASEKERRKPATPPVRPPAKSAEPPSQPEVQP